MCRSLIPRGAKGGRQSRPAFTLLEVLLATAIGVLLMSALYVAVDVQLRHAQAARDLVEHGTLARALFVRIASDITPTMAPALPSTSTSSGGGGAAAGSSTTTDTSSSGTATTGTTDSNSSSTTAASTESTFNVGVLGDSSRLILCMSRSPRELDVGVDAGVDLENLPFVSDIRRITYWLVGGEEVPLGLARQEINLVASDDLMSALPPDVPDDPTYGVRLLAEEVKSLTFSYWDGTAWQETWDSTQVGADGRTPLGPPLGIAVVLGIASPGARGESNVKLYRHFFNLPTANGLPADQNATMTPQ